MISQREEMIKFEKDRIKALQEERLHIQKKTFTKWMNSFLGKVRMEVDDLFTDLADGKKLLKLLEIISGEKLGKPNNGKMRVHKIENVNKSLAFLHTKVRLESIGAEDIVDGNPRLILGLIWTIILRFQIQEIEIDVDEENESSEKKSAKDALLLWCQRKTQGYRGVHITDFTTSWRSGLGFNALIHAHRPDLINYDALNPQNHIYNLNNAFDVAYRELGVAKLLDAEDIDVHRPDEKSVMTYVASYYHTFAKMKTEMKGGRRIANIVNQMIEVDKAKGDYETFTTDLLEWINEKIKILEDRNFPNVVHGIQALMTEFKKYRTEEKPPKYRERSEIEAMLFSIQTKLKSLGKPLYNPPEGKIVHDIERAWEQLEKAEHRREVALRDALLELEKLEMLAYKFERKRVLREGYLKEMFQVLLDPRYGSNVSQVEATVKKHEAISADILAREDRFLNLSKMADVLEASNYHNKLKLLKKKEEVISKWKDLLKLLEKHQKTLMTRSRLRELLRDVEAVINEIKDVEYTLRSQDMGKHLFAIEDLSQKLAVMNSQITVLGTKVSRLNREGKEFLDTDSEGGNNLQDRLNEMNSSFNNLLKLSKDYEQKLEESQEYLQFMNDADEEEAWVNEKQHICRAIVSGKDLLAVLSLQQKHKALEDEMKARWPKSEHLFKKGEEFSKKCHSRTKEVHERIASLKDKWKELQELSARRRKQLEDAAEAYQFYADANEAQSWMKEKLPVVSSTDYGKDEPSAQSQLQRLSHLEGELKAYAVDIQKLNEQADKLISEGITSLSLMEEAPVTVKEEIEEYIEEVQFVPVEVEVEEDVVKEVLREVTEERKIPQVQALYPFKGQGMVMAKGEIMVLLSKTNDDWWNVRKSSGVDGFVPASYVKEVEPKVFHKKIQKPVKVFEKQKVKKIVTKKQVVRRKKDRSPRLIAKSLKAVRSRPEETETVDKRRQNINEQYLQLLKLAADRRLFLIDAIRLFGFYFECDDFESWMKEKERMLTSDDTNESVEVLKQKFENFLTDLLASRSRLEDIDLMVAEFKRAGHSQLALVCARQNQILDKWARLERLTKEKERSLEGASRFELFNRQCDETCEWMLEKMNKMDTDDLGKDLRTVQALKSKHENIERELAPIEDKVNRLHLLAESVKSSYPNEKANVDVRQQEVDNLWLEVKKKAQERRARLEEAVGTQIFNNSTKNLLAWVGDVKEALNNDEAAKDIATAEKLIKDHEDLSTDIQAHQDEFHALRQFGESLLNRNPDREDVKEKLILLEEEREALIRGWREKDKWLKDCLALQIFNREADQIDAATSAHNKFLEFEELGETIDDVELLLKRQDEFENTLTVQDERLNYFNQMVDNLILSEHYDRDNVNQRRNQVLKRRLAVKEKAKDRKKMLLASKAYQEFQANANEMQAWIQDKLKVASDESYKDLSNLEIKLKKHEAFERELRSSETRLRHITAVGLDLIEEGHYASDNIQGTLDNLQQQWELLCKRTEDKGNKLRDAASLRAYNRTVDDVRTRLDSIDDELNSPDVGSDLRSVKSLLVRNENLAADLANMENKTNNLIRLGNAMAEEGHFDAPNILKHAKELQNKYFQLTGPAIKRKQQLEEALKHQQFLFEVESEMQWIKERISLASSKEVGQSLLEAQNLFKKHVKLERECVGHKPIIDRILTQGVALIEAHHWASDIINEKCNDLKDVWATLNDCLKDKRRKFELSLRAQEFFHDTAEIELWMTEKNDLLGNKDYGKDEDSVIKLLTKHKALELEIDSYSGLVAEMGNQAQNMIDSGHPDSKVIQSRQELILQQMKNLQKVAAARRVKLMEALHKHEYLRESAELEQWINEQMQTALFEDYGQDYEHLLLLQKRFDDFHHHVESNTDRFIQCEKLAKKLLAGESSFSSEISERQEQLEKSWKLLLDQIASRDQKLHAAGEIHRFNRDVADALARIQEKYASISEDRGRDINSVTSLIRRHEGFENELVALEAQLQVIIDDSARLQAAYPGQNAEHIHEQQIIVVENWKTLSEKAAERKKELQASCDLQRFLASVRDLCNWANNLRKSIMTEEKVRDAASAQLLKAEHDRLKSEIEAREESFRAVVQAGQTMIQDKHYASEDINDKVDQLLEARQNLHTDWQHKKVFLEQLIDLQFFLRDAKQLDTISNSQETYLTGLIMGSTVEEIDSKAKKHEEFEKLVASQEEKMLSLQDHGGKLISQDHFDKINIQNRMEEVAGRRARIKDLCQIRKRNLADALLYAHFKRDVAEVESWLEEKKKKHAAENLTSEVSLEDKIKKLQKHQAFQAELAANESRIAEVIEKGEILRKQQHEESAQIKRQIDNLLKLWNDLKAEVDSHARGLEEAQDILDFNNQVDKVEAWIRDKELMVQARDTGRDFEHCCALQRKLDDVDSDMRVDDSRMSTINLLADRLIRQGRSNTKAIQLRRDELNQKWRALVGSLDEYRELLAVALEIHAFNRDCDDINERIHEKSMAFTVEDSGKDLASVESLQRKFDAIENAIGAIEVKIKEQDSESRRLMQKYPDMAGAIRKKFSEVNENWRNLVAQCEQRRQLLASSYTLQKFLFEMLELETWVNDMSSRMREGGLAKNVSEAQNLLQLHHERKAEINGRQESFKSLKEFGYRLVQKDHYAKGEIENKLLYLEELRRTLIQAWEERMQMLSQSLDLQNFYNHANFADDWLTSKEAFLNNDDLGDSISSVETLIRKHDGFEKTVEAQSSVIENLEKFATELVANKHFASADIHSRLQAVCQRRDHLKENSMIRRKRLKESKQLQHFLRNIHEVVGWIQEKIQIAADESYRDSTNLQSKIQKHQAFEAELTANEARIDAVTKEGENLIGAGHFAGMEVQSQLDELEYSWRLLVDKSRQKKERLHDAYQALLYTRTLDELDAWMDDVETQLQSEDHGTDLTGVQKLLKRHQLLESDIHSHAENIEQVKDIAANFARNNHFMSDEIQERRDEVVKRYTSLHEPLQIRRENLEDALLLHQFLRDVNDETSWIKDKERLALSLDWGNSLVSVQNLQKKHKALEAEIQTHEPLITAVISKGQQMLRSNHFASSEIEKAMQSLTSQLQELKDRASIRRLRLADALESQTFYTEVNEAKAWIEDKTQVLIAADHGRDQDSVQSLLKKHEGLQRDVESFGAYVARLHQVGQQLIDRHHFDSETIEKYQTEMEKLYKDLQTLTDVRRRRLIDSKKLYKYLNEASEVAEWIDEQTTVAASEDYGTDVEHVEILIQKFESFLNSLNASEERVANISKMAHTLIKEGHPEPEKIQYKADEILQLWEDLKEVAQQRKEALSGAKEIHIFDRKADEAITWMQEKDAALSNDDYGPDLESIQILLRKHEGFERDLAAVKEQVEMVISEARRLVDLFPDAHDHISVKNEETINVWNLLLDKSANRKEKLNQAEHLQAYFDEFRELMAWLNEMMAKVTAAELARDARGAETLLARHQEYRTEIDTRSDAIKLFRSHGKKLIADGHFMAGEIQEKIHRLKSGHVMLLQTWEKRNELYELNLSVQIFKRDCDQLENWIVQREPVLHDGVFGNSIGEVEDLIRKHDDFEKTILAHQDLFEGLKKLTLLEEQFREQKKEEEEMKKKEGQRRDQERLDAMKRKEHQRILDERRKESGERRRTQEIKFTPEDENVVSIPLNGDVSSISGNQLYISGSGAPSPKIHRSRRNSSDVPEHLKLSIAKDMETSTKLRRVESMHSDALLKKPEITTSLKRAESLKGTEPPFRGNKRTPSFTTRRRGSFKLKPKTDQDMTLPPVEMEGHLERKQECQSHGKRATVRSWKSFYTVLCGQLMCFFKEKRDFLEKKAAVSPINIHDAECKVAMDYTKRKHVFRISLKDGSEYLFSTDKAGYLEDWIKKISFHAKLPPSQQLLSYDNQHSDAYYETRRRSSSISSTESYASANEEKSSVSQHPYGGSPQTHSEKSSTEDHVYSNVLSHVQRIEMAKPVVPPRSTSMGSSSSDIQSPTHQKTRSSATEGIESRHQYGNEPRSSESVVYSTSGYYRHSADAPDIPQDYSYRNEDIEPPPLPVSQPPLYVFQRPSSNMSSYTSEDTEDDWHEGDNVEGLSNYGRRHQFEEQSSPTEQRFPSLPTYGHYDSSPKGSSMRSYSSSSSTLDNHGLKSSAGSDDSAASKKKKKWWQLKK